MHEAENWKIALKLYEGHPIPALLLAHQLMAIKRCLARGRKGIPDAIAGLELASANVYTHTDFDKMGRKFFRRTIEGTLRPEHEEKLHPARQSP